MSDQTIEQRLEAELEPILGTHVKQSILYHNLLQLINNNNTPTKICGRTIGEVIVILNALDVYEETDIKVTMSNLDRLYKQLRKEAQESVQKALNNAITLNPKEKTNE